MAITVFNPNDLCFAGNPIIVKAKTDKVLGELESFLRIELNGYVSIGSHGSIPSYPVELSQPVENGGTAVFNLSDSVSAMILRAQSMIDANDDSPSSESSWHTPISVTCMYRCQEVWISDNQEVRGNETPEAYQFAVVPGKLTDYELLTMDSIDLTTLKREKPMTRKPDLGIIYGGETIIMPVISDGNTPASHLGINYEDGGRNYIHCRFLKDGLGYAFGQTNGGTDGKITFELSYEEYDRSKFTLSGYYRTNTHGVHFLRFINGFGAVENISVRSKDKLSYEVSGETHSLVQGATTRPTDRRYATKSQPAGVYELSSGYVPKQWAEWFVQELLTSPRVWIQLGGKWVPALIEAKDDCVIYDRTKPEMPHVDFTLRLAIDGVTGVTW